MSSSPVNKVLGKYISHPVLQQLLIVRGIDSTEKAADFFNHEISEIAGAQELYDIKSAVKRIRKAKKNNEKVIVYGDYDADGILATAILWEYLYREMGINAVPYIPSRFEHGYGLHPDALQELKDNGAELIITVDCGIRNKELIAEWQNKGLDFIVTDHHQPGSEIPECVVVHPMHPEKSFANTVTSGAMVAWYLVQALHQAQHNKSDLDNEQRYQLGMDLAAMSIVTDMMPLLGDNRRIVKHALAKLAQTNRSGLQELITVSGITDSELDTYHIGFLIGPRLNAAGRLGDPLDGVRLLLSNNQSKVAELARKLDQLNSKRQQITYQLMEEIESNLDKFSQEGFIFAHGKDWNEGIIGLVAGKLQEKYKKPVFVITVNENEARGSCRSIPGINIVKAIESSSELLTKYGGHESAAGFSLMPNKLEEWQRQLEQVMGEAMASSDSSSLISYDLELPVEQVSAELVSELDKLAPFGEGNPRPVWKFTGWAVRDFRLVGQNNRHLTLNLQSSTGQNIKAIYFNGHSLYNNLRQGQRIELIGTLEFNEWNGQIDLQIKVKDLSVI